MLEKGQIIDLKENNLSIRNDGKVVDNNLNIYIGILPKENLSWFKPALDLDTIREIKYQKVTTMVALNDFTEEYRDNIFSVKHLQSPLVEFNLHNDNTKGYILTNLLEKIDKLELDDYDAC